VSGTDGRRIEMVGNPIKLAGDAPIASGYPPRLGEHTASVLAELLSLSEEEIASLHDNGVIRVAASEPVVRLGVEATTMEQGTD
jgi:crotonobetainyl-CoA:carnitine CoA-transferase CaiB-like acyl-CoA transferase